MNNAQRKAMFAKMNHRKPYHTRYLTEAEQQKVYEEYYATPVTNVKVADDSISLKYGEKQLKYPYKEVPHRDDIGSWAHKPGDNTIVIDRTIDDKRKPGVLVHEAVEQHMEKDKDLGYGFAHKAALSSEKPFVTKKLKQNWQGYQNSVLNTRK
jgi:hypothetical protein